MNKTIIVINGKGGCGKDTLCNFASEKYPTLNVSSIDPMKKMAEIIGWNGSKTLEDRKFLADLKSLVTRYNDGANEYILKKAEEFAGLPEYKVMFVHIREPEMIEHFKETVKHRVCGITVVTLLVSRNEKDYLVFGNRADDEVNKYNYDHVFENNDDLHSTKESFLKFLDSVLTD